MSQWVKKSRQKKINNSRQFNLNFPQHAKYSKLVLTHITKIYLISRVYFHFELQVYRCVYFKDVISSVFLLKRKLTLAVTNLKHLSYNYFVSLTLTI